MNAGQNGVAPVAPLAASSALPLSRTHEEIENQAARRDLASTERKVRIGFAVALICLAAIGLVSYLSVVRLTEDAAWVEHTHEVLGSLELLLAGVADSERAERGYIITGDESYLDAYREGAAVAEAHMRRVRSLTKDNRAQQQRLDLMLPLVTARLAQLRAVMQVRQDKGFAAAQTEVLSGTGKQLHERIRLLIAQMADAETSLLAARKQRTARSSIIVKSIIIGGGFLACVIVGLALMAIRRDLAGRVRAEGALRKANDQLELRVRERTAELQKAGETRARLASIVESSDDAIVSKNLDGIITSWNPGAQRLFGYSELEMLGKPLTAVIPPDRLHEEREILQRIARGQVTEHFETVRVRKDGEAIDVSVTISPIRNDAGELIGASKIARDITERRQVDRKLRAQLAKLDLLARTTRAIGARLDVKSILQVAMRSLEDDLPVDFGCVCLYEPVRRHLAVVCVGVKSKSLALQLAMGEEALVEIDQNGLSRCVRGQLIHEPDITRSTFPFPRRLAAAGLSSFVAAPLMLESKVFGVVVVARREAGQFTSSDCEFLQQMSEHLALALHQAELYDALQRAYEDLRQTQQTVMQQERLRALGQMASGIAHDINNALAPATLYTQMLLERESSLSERAREFLGVIQQAIEGVANTVARMKEFYRQREPQLAHAAVDLNRVLGQAIDLTRARWSDMAEERGSVIQMKTALAAELPGVLGAESEIRDAVTNLILNAVDAMPQGGTLTLCTQAPEPDQVRIEITDTGVGMDEDTRARCLEPFFTTKGERGSGLGLAMVYGMLERHGGEIQIDSAPGKGTSIRLIFPRALTTASAGESVSAATVAPLQSLQILLVDDHPVLLKSLRDALEQEGHVVAVADGGQRGIDAFNAAHRRGEPFGAVITDLGMPHIDGRRVAAAVKSAAPDVPVILLTGWGHRLIAENDLPAGVDRVLSKPPKLAALRAALVELTGKRTS
jgi:PAS domain S-box-containing protein